MTHQLIIFPNLMPFTIVILKLMKEDDHTYLWPGIKNSVPKDNTAL
jgi:hypothetical protein